MRRASVETIEKLVQSKADQARERRVSLTIMNCLWARNTEQETSHPVHGEVIGKLFNEKKFLKFPAKNQKPNFCQFVGAKSQIF